MSKLTKKLLGLFVLLIGLSASQYLLNKNGVDVRDSLIIISLIYFPTVIDGFLARGDS